MSAIDFTMDVGEARLKITMCGKRPPSKRF
jgi:hypothetical protein